MLKLEKQKYNSFLISASSQEELSLSFLRFQEHYESPYWADKIFTIGQYKKWYSEQYGADTYHLDWSGFNFPSCVLNSFRQGLFDPLTENEKIILDFFKYKTDNFYIIGSNTNDVLFHELNHAFYNYNTKYKEEIICLFDKNKNKIKKALEYLIKKGYHKKVLYDELQAYVLDDNIFFKDNVPNKIINEIINLRKNFDK